MSRRVRKWLLNVPKKALSKPEVQEITKQEGIVIGLPRRNEGESEFELTKKGMVGIYKEVQIDERTNKFGRRHSSQRP